MFGRLFQCMLLAGTLAAPFVVAVCDAAERPNVLLISIDDLRPELKCYGAGHILSPNIDRLAESGVVFDRCYVQVAVCNPSRASTFTGLRPDRLGCWTLPVHFRESMPDAVTLPQYFRQHGYTCEGIGKIFHNPWQDPRSWSRPHQWPDAKLTHYSPEQKAFRAKVAETIEEDDWRHNNLRGVIANAPDIDDVEHMDGAMTVMAVDRLKELSQSEQPFLLAVGYIQPHLPWCPPKRWWDKYDRDSLPLADNPYPPKNAPEVSVGTNYEMTHYADAIDVPKPHEGSVSDADARRYRHAYFASVSFIDAQVGKLLDALDEQQLADNTIVVLWSDHGWKLGEHNGWSKMTNLEIDTRIPMIIRAPEAKANGQHTNRIVESLDLFPTLCDLTGLPIPEFLDGHSAASLLNDPAAPHTGVAYSQYIWRPLIGNSIRTDRWRYVEWRDMDDATIKHQELYDHKNDPDENVNVFGQHPEVEDDLHIRVQKVLVPHKIVLRPRIHSARGTQRTNVTLNNGYDGKVRVTWINPLGQRRNTFDIPAKEKRPLNTFVGHVFSIESLDGRYHELITIGRNDEILRLGDRPMAADK
ncbi:sulfatase-like hydrolase/transferase [Bremerella sp. P1]|uniref:sulfatase-like hydrolase/transferase n=1 Tax=Bremerella sp. P1 TaxID=3026424 RepID=UPI0023682DEE|nr:sulfatase-like hydrolase/transferase [Bremerella sp. P1]WDI44050.1 sulfatase-like hydrolase/transferase [Bremerella sp. P1]